MEETGAYGETLRRTFKTEVAPSFVARTLRNSKVAVTEIRCDNENTGMTLPIPREDAFLVTVQLKDVPSHGLFVDDRRVPTSFLPAGTANIYDLRASPVADSISAFHHVSFYLPRIALREVTEREAIPDADGFDHNPGVGVQDPVLHSLARAMLACFRTPDLANRLFVDHVTIAATAHAVKRYACQQRSPHVGAHALSPLEIRRAREQIAEHLDGDVPLESLSDETGLPPLDFAASFELSAGVSIHRWRSDLRIERAKRMLQKGYDLETTAKLLDYASTARFVADFRRRTGLDPATTAQAKKR
ncbi:MAG: AraC family transcriptional regulator [Rhizobium sp.]|nr:MAG: AraC family transcriptional regulator [Rhizobium sp.]